jgi:type IV secretory pathway protease TraF
VLGGLVLAAVLSTRWVRVNVSPSVPVGLYRLAPLSVALARGTLVVLPVPASIQAFHSRWVPLLKPVAALAGDVVCVWGSTLWVWGPTAGAEPTWYGLVWREHQGRPLPRIEGCHLVQDGTVFLASAAPNSLDSRYCAAVPISTLTAQAFPLVTWRSRACDTSFAASQPCRSVSGGAPDAQRSRRTMPRLQQRLVR